MVPDQDEAEVIAGLRVERLEEARKSASPSSINRTSPHDAQELGEHVHRLPSLRKALRADPILNRHLTARRRVRQEAS